VALPGADFVDGVHCLDGCHHLKATVGVGHHEVRPEKLAARALDGHLEDRDIDVRLEVGIVVVREREALGRDVGGRAILNSRRGLVEWHALSSHPKQARNQGEGHAA